MVECVHRPPFGGLTNRRIRPIHHIQGNRTYGSCLIIWELLPEDAEAALKKQVEAWEARQAERRRQQAEEMPPLRREGGKAAAFFAKGSLQDGGISGSSSSSGSGSDSDRARVDGGAGEGGEEERAAAAQGIYLPRCLCVLSKYPFVSTTRSWLMQLYRLSLTPTPGKQGQPAPPKQKEDHRQSINQQSTHRIFS